MSQENVEIVRQLIQAWNRRADGWVESYHPEAEFHMPPEWPGDPVYSGHDSIVRCAAELADNFNNAQWEIQRLIDADERVVVTILVRGRIESSGSWIAQPLGAVFDLRDGEINRVLTYFSWAEALEAVGLSG
jgi:ketosteroid isomerase-like protein